MTTRLETSCSFSLLFVSFVNVYQFVCVHLSFLVLRVGCGISLYNIVVPDHCHSFYFSNYVSITILSLNY